MMTRISPVVLIVCCFQILAVRCDRPVCENANPLFDKYSPNTKEYNDELVNQLARVDRSNLSYWMDIYHEDKTSQCILADVQGDGLCAKIVLVVNDSYKGIERLFENRGVGYRGPSLKT